MDSVTKERITQSIRDFTLPGYNEIPDVGLYLEQTTKYISQYLEPLQNITVTGSMLSNYVKKGLVDNPVKKQYYREQIAYFFFIAVAKSVLSLDDINLLIQLQRKTYASQTAYDYFCREFLNVLHYVFGMKETLGNVGADVSDEKTMLRNTIITVAHKVYLDKYFDALHHDDENELC